MAKMSSIAVSQNQTALAFLLVEGPTFSLANTASLSFPLACLAPNVHCSDGTCVGNSQVCDTTLDCPDGEDERNCRKLASHAFFVVVVVVLIRPGHTPSGLVKISTQLGLVS